MTEEIAMNGTVQYELAKTMIAERQREAQRRHAYGTGREARRARLQLPLVARRVRIFLHTRTA